MKRRDSHPAPVSLVPAADAAAFDDQQVLTFREWCRLNAVSPRTGRRILASGEGPVVTQLSASRIGITRGNNRRWQESRARRVA
jgi:hypothetical protein